mgnify:CR=1 FL=1
MVSIVSNCDLNQAKNLSELEKKIFNTSWEPSWIREKINNCVALTSEIVDLNPKFSSIYSRIRVLRETILLIIK